MYDDASEAKKRAVEAISSALPNLFKGTLLLKFLMNDLSCVFLLPATLPFIPPGHKVLTLILT